MRPIEIKPQLYWIGALHPDLRVFDIIMATKNGTTYNSYLIKDEKIAVIDTVKEKFATAFIERIGELVDPARIDYIIVQHTEMDHSGSLQALLALAPNAQIICTKPAVKYVQKVIHQEASFLIADANLSVSLGSRQLQFIPAPFLHWPDTMMTYLPEDQALFSCDVFSSHFCDSRLFDDQITRDFWPEYEYYFRTIFRPFKKHVRNGLKKLSEVPFQVIAPAHGPILRHSIKKYIEAYETWAAPLPGNTPKKALIFYASAYGNTEEMAHQVAHGMESAGLQVVLIDATTIKPEDYLDEIEKADALLFGSPTINNDAVKPIWDILSGLVTVDNKGKVAASFGSMGWSGEAVEMLDQRLLSLKFKVPVPGFKAVLIPDADELAKCVEFGRTVAAAV